MLEQVLTELRNWFLVPGGIHPGEYAVEGGLLTLPFLQDEQYFRILGSTFNDGLHRYGPAMVLLKDETFTGAVWVLAVPPAVEALAQEIAAWREKYGEIIDSPYISESFGGYTYTKSKDTGDRWQEVFRRRLNPYRKLREL